MSFVAGKSLEKRGRRRGFEVGLMRRRVGVMKDSVAKRENVLDEQQQRLTAGPSSSGM